jgi:hypothetical protein
VSVCDDYVQPDEGGGGTGDGSDPVPTSPPEYEFDPKALRRTLLENTIKLDPYALFDIPCEDLEHYKRIANKEIPAEVYARLDSLKNSMDLWQALKPYADWNILELENAGGVQINLDYYAVKIDKLPPYTTAEELINEIRSNINGFVDTEVSEFTPFPGISNESNRWQDYPLGSIIQIDMGAEYIGNIEDGSVICSNYQDTTWTFSTIKCPADFEHPVSGNREFAIKQLPDGSYEIYTSGVDRITSVTDDIVRFILETGADYNPYFESADKLWKSFQDNVLEYVNQTGGSATLPDKRNRGSILYYPDIKDYIDGKITLTELRNDC